MEEQLESQSATAFRQRFGSSSKSFQGCAMRGKGFRSQSVHIQLVCTELLRPANGKQLRARSAARAQSSLLPESSTQHRQDPRERSPDGLHERDGECEADVGIASAPPSAELTLPTRDCWHHRRITNFRQSPSRRHRALSSASSTPTANHAGRPPPAEHLPALHPDFPRSFYLGLFPAA